MKLRLITILVLISSLSFAQNKNNKTISGYIHDKDNGEVLIGATIFLKGSTNGAVSNEYGFYSLTVPKGTYDIVSSFIGYRSFEQKIVLDENLKLNIELSENAEQLSEVLITADDGKEVNLRSPQMSVTKMKTKTIKQIPAVLGEVDIIKSIQLLPGITNAGEGASGFNVRGGAEDQNLVLLDEAIIYNSSHMFGFFSVFNADAVKGIKLYKGGIPARFGGRVSSVLDIRQRDGNKKNLKFTGGIGLISSRLTVEGPTIKNKGSFLISGRTSYAHLFMGLSDQTEGNKVRFYDINFKTNLEFNANNRLYLSGYYGDDDIEFGESFLNSYGNFTSNLRWNHIFSNKVFANLSLIYSHYNYDMEINMFDFNWKSDINNYNLKYDVDYYINNNYNLKLGLSGIYYNFNPGEIIPSSSSSEVNERTLEKKHAVETGIYAALEQKITDKLTAQYGIRYSNFIRLGKQNLNEYANNLPVVYNSDIDIYESAVATGTINYSTGENIADFGNFEPRLALSYKINSKSSVKLSYNRMAQYLHLISNTASATPLDIWTPSGKYIKPQIGNQYAAGYFLNFNEQMYSIEAETYYKTVDNRMDYIDGASLVAQEHIETQILNGKSRAYGVELLLRKNIGDLTGWVSYTISKAQQQTIGGNAGGSGINNGEWYNTAYDRTHDISMTATYKLNDKWRFGANFVYQTGRPVTYPNGQFRYNDLSIATYANRNENRLPAYHRLDISATLTPRKNKNRKWQSEWVFGFYNLYNRRNAASITFGQNIDNGSNEATRTSIFGIMPTITYNFKF